MQRRHNNQLNHDSSKPFSLNNNNNLASNNEGSVPTDHWECVCSTIPLGTSGSMEALLLRLDRFNYSSRNAFADINRGGPVELVKWQMTGTIAT